MNKADRARELFGQGYNCSQTIMGTFAEEFPLSFEEVMHLAAPLGGGMGRLREVCGAVSGMCMVAGAVFGYSRPEQIEEKAMLYALERHLAQRFREENGTILCRELLGLQQAEASPVPQKRDEAYYAARPCGELCAHAAAILEEELAFRRAYPAQWQQGEEQPPLSYPVRQAVFLEEQGFSTEFDDIDATAWHLWLLHEGKPVAAARLYFEGEDCRLGRICVLPTYRGKKLGARLMEQLLWKAEILGAKRLVLGAQEDKQDFYRGFGFTPCGPRYMDEFCPHIPMERQLEE